jgi:hypothetical protein
MAEEIYYTPSFSKLPFTDTHYFSATKVLSNLMELLIISMGHIFRQGLQIRLCSIFLKHYK